MAAFSAGSNNGISVWIQRFLIICICAGVLISVTLFGGEEPKLDLNNGFSWNPDTHSLKNSKAVPTNANAMINGAVPTNNDNGLDKVKAFDQDRFTEDDEFYSRMLGKKYGSGPYPTKESKSSKSSKSGGPSGDGDDDDSKSGGGSMSKGGSSKESKGGGPSRDDDDSKSGEDSKSKGGPPKGSKSRGSDKGNDGSVSKGSKSRGPGKGNDGSVSMVSDSRPSSGKGIDRSVSKGSKSRRSPGKGDGGSMSKGSKSNRSAGKGNDSESKSDQNYGKDKPKKDKGKKKKKNDKKKGKKKRLPFEYGHLRRLNASDQDQQVENHDDAANHEFHGLRSTGHKPNVSTDLVRISTEELQKITTRFYIYDDPVISQFRIINKYRQMGKAAFADSADFDHVKTDMKGEQLILKVLGQHPLRTFDPQEAEIFVVPTPITELLAYGCQWENCTWYDEAFDALTKQPTFKQEQGHKHVVVALSWPSFNKRYSAFLPALSRNYVRLENVTVAHNYDPFGCLALREHTEASREHNDFSKVYQRELPVTNSFSLGLGFNDPFPVHLPTYEKFETSDYFLFYRSRVKSFAYGSTPYRNAPLEDEVIDKLPPSSIGNDVPFDEWVHGFTSSKFCLVIRGDTPHSHSLLYAVRAGCIPVVVSDDYAAYATPFKSSMAIENFAVFIKEHDFLNDPAEQLLKLQDLPEDVIHTKLDNLYDAQTMVVPNHPRSLFVQALLKEAFEAEQNVIPSANKQVKVLQDYAVLSGWEFLYRYPSTLSSDTSASSSAGRPNVIVGVISKAHRFNARHAIRGTWATESPHRVFFIVGGPWKDIEEEFHVHGDLIWLDTSDQEDNGDLLATNKVHLFLQAVDTHVKSYDYIMKTNDDTYVWLDDVDHHLAKANPDYWGTCKTKYTKNSKQVSSPRAKYAHGTGYILSRTFNRCANTYIVSSEFKSIPEEDVATGYLAELCGVSCNDEGWDWWKPGKKSTALKFIDGHKKSSEEMLYKHWYVMWRRGGWDV